MSQNVVGDINGSEESYYLLFQPLLTLLNPNFSSLQFHDTSIISYLSELIESSISELSEKQNELNIKDRKATYDLVEIMQKEYDHFITVLNYKNSFSRSFNILDESVNKIQTTITSINEKVLNFESLKDGFNEILTEFRLLHQYQEYILNLFEIPSLIETCIKNNNYSEAINLISYGKKLGDEYFQIDIIQDLVKQVNYMSEYLQRQLLLLLKGTIKLTEAIKVIGYLRRTNEFLEIELCYIFLLSRWNYMDGLISNLNSSNKDNPEKYLKEYIGIFREHSFNIFSYYTLIFLKEESVFYVFSENSENSISTKNNDNLNEKISRRRMLSNFALHMVSELKNTLAKYIPYISDNEVKALILNRILHCGQSLGRIGVDFSLALVDIFGDEWTDLIKNHENMMRNLETSIEI
ncbi:hypothetical protein PNEG_01359 [Pneumocystis murina B123]|uniref:Conserved oligomeric Golgi complex subunit 8 n=1 Tax=Pneumocystis murina (strain B123) TaxID=1069680 RepID=M7P9W1_PNEMU|nr:hypothetical protein PNEG_01359 [Pneumocystis murina B123]EMR10660.1 hypothetical protein PNEG_01359 [Pneumocystis murina B123]